MIASCLILGALAYLFWPAGKPAATSMFTIPPATPSPAPPASPAAVPPQPAPGSREAIDCLLAVRDRLAATEALDDAASAAVDTLWLDLLHGTQNK